MFEGLSGGTILPPVVSLVVINFNYASYVGAAIDSILAQDYPLIDAIIVDNGSTDGSRDVIARHVGKDPRFRIICLDRNLGQLGALFHVLDEIRGDFVTIVDADDLLSSSYVSSHVQVHLALPQSVAFTSSNVIQINAEGRAFASGYGSFGKGQTAANRLLSPLEFPPRLPTVSDRHYRQLMEATSVIPHTQAGWFWGPGTSNMYRRSVLNAIRQRRGGEPYLRAADGYLNPLSHALGGSAPIDRQLSAYRVHGANYYAAHESLGGMRNGRPEIEAVNQTMDRETIDFILRHVDHFVGLVGKQRFWGVIDQISQDPQSRRVLSLPDMQKALADNFPDLSRTFGEKTLCDELLRRVRSKPLRAVLRNAHGGRVPFRLGVTAFRQAWKRAAAQRRERRNQEKPIAAQAQLAAFVQTQRDAPKPVLRERERIKSSSEGRGGPRGFGPVAFLSRDPPVFMTGIAYDGFLGIAPAFGDRYGDVDAGFMIYPTWSIENAGLCARIRAAALAHGRRFPKHKLLFLCNTQREADLLWLAGLPAIHLNKNFTVSDTIFRPLPDAVIEFDAIYNAQFAPFKRHELAAKVGRVALLTYIDGSDGRDEKQKELLAATLVRSPSHVLINPLVEGFPVRLSPPEVNAALNRAAVGLCLSAVEGSNYASMEYMLAGLPVVSTPSEGGRDVFFDPEFCVICEPDPEAVRDAVAGLKARNIPRDYIRARTLAKIEPMRRRFLTLADEIASNLGGQRRFHGPWPFGETNAIVTWDTFQNHLNVFDSSGATPSIAKENAIEIDLLSADLTDIQLQPSELRPIIKEISARPGCSLLVFGCGNDSVLWERANRDGTTAFLEDDPEWLKLVRARLTKAEAHLVRYGTKRSDWAALLNSPDRLRLDLPAEISSRRWEVVLVDGPAGFDDEQPGRMKSIFAAAELVAPGGCVFVHDCDRQVEREYAARYLGNHRLFIEVKGRSILNGYAF